MSLGMFGGTSYKPKAAEDSTLSKLFSKEQQNKFKVLKADANPQTVVFLKEGHGQKVEEEEEILDSTIFVGNVPLTATHKSVKRHFAHIGPIDKVWFRSIPTESNKMGKKASHIMKKYVEDADSMNAYVRFKEIEHAQKACELNATKYEHLTIRVSLCHSKELDCQTTIFVGNLPLDAKEEQLRQLFAHIGPINNVRVIKNRETSLGIGVGYVRFQSKQEMQTAINTMNGVEMRGRGLRVKRAVEKSRKQKKIRNVIRRKQTKMQKSLGKSNASDKQVELKKAEKVAASVKVNQKERQKKKAEKEKLEGKGTAVQQQKKTPSKTKGIKK